MNSDRNHHDGKEPKHGNNRRGGSAEVHKSSRTGRAGIVNDDTERLGRELGLTERKPRARKLPPAYHYGSGKKKPEDSGNPKKNPVKKAAVKQDASAPSLRQRTNTRKQAENVKIIPIGGLNEIGKNMTLIEYHGRILIIDCGMAFPDNDMFGIDVVIPDFRYLVKNADRIDGMIITHGHEDHIGGVPYLLKQISVPIYGSALSIGLIKNKLDEHGLKGDLHQIRHGDKFSLGEFRIEAYRTTHSIADALCFCILTPAATIFHTGDFKIDYTPIDGEPIDFGEIAAVGKRGVDILLADSTNATKPGYTRSEQVVGETLDGIFRDVQKRIIIATFSSNVNRVQKIIDLSLKYGRKFAISGRSMENVVRLAVELGYLKFPQESFVELSEIRNIPDDEITIITTGSQGEPLSALARMANDEHRTIKLKKGDTVILSSSPVPGNEKSVSNIVNRLYEKNVNVIYKDVADIHVSGHASREDLKLMHVLIRPKFFMPVHGEHRHLVHHAELAKELGMRPDNIFILKNGDQLTLDRKRAVKFNNIVPAEDVMIDSFDIGDIGDIVLKDRKMLSESGLIVVTAGIDRRTHQLVSGPELVSRGYVYVKESEELMNDAQRVVREAIEQSLAGGFREWSVLKNDVRDALRRYLFDRTRKSPLILTVFLEV